MEIMTHHHQEQNCSNTSAMTMTVTVTSLRNSKYPIVRLTSVVTLLVLQYIVLSPLYKHLPDPKQQVPLRNHGLLPMNEYDTYTISKSDSTNYDFPPNEVLNVEPTLHRQCVTVRFRGDTNNYTVDDAIHVLAQKYVTRPGPHALRIGIMILEDVDTFFPVRIRKEGSNYHMYHFVELIVMAYTELLRMSDTLLVPVRTGYNPTMNDIHNNDTTTTSYIVPPTSMGMGSPSISVPWIFSPYMSPVEICGGISQINCLIADLIFRGSKSSIFSDKTGIIGLNEMEQFPFDYTDIKMKGVEKRIELAKYVYENHPTFTTNHADGVIMIERFGCDMGGINKPWSSYIDSFSPDAWHSDVLLGLEQTSEFHNNNSNNSNNTNNNRRSSASLFNTKKLVVCYIDRQNTDRKLPDEHHTWLVQYGTNHEKIDFRQLHMEDYEAIQQIEMATECDVMIGMHGNGMTHTLWMQPRRYVIEFFWKYNYQYDYATIAHLLTHTYLGLLNGQVVDPIRVSDRDPLLRKSPTRKEAQHAPLSESMQAFETDGKPAIQLFIEKAIHELHL